MKKRKLNIYNLRKENKIPVKDLLKATGHKKSAYSVWYRKENQQMPFLSPELIALKDKYNWSIDEMLTEIRKRREINK